MITEQDLRHLRRCIELAAESLEAGNNPYGAVLVAADGTVLHEEHNTSSATNRLGHPEFKIAQWAVENLDPETRASATVYTSGEHCAMCSAAHGWVGLGRIVYAASTLETDSWRREFGGPPQPVARLRVTDVIVNAEVDGPVEELLDELRELHRRRHERDA